MLMHIFPFWTTEIAGVVYVYHFIFQHSPHQNEGIFPVVGLVS
jgi:hypothetical protein